MGIVRGWYHPKGPGDVPLEVARLLGVTQDALDYAKAKRNGGTGVTG